MYPRVQVGGGRAETESTNIQCGRWGCIYGFNSKITICKNLSCFSGQVLNFNFLKVLCLFVFSVPEPSKEVGDVFKFTWDVLCIEFAYGNG